MSKACSKTVLVGRPFFIVACMLTARESAGLLAQFQQAELGREVLGEEAQPSTPDRNDLIRRSNESGCRWEGSRRLRGHGIRGC